MIRRKTLFYKHFVEKEKRYNYVRGKGVKLGLTDEELYIMELRWRLFWEPEFLEQVRSMVLGDEVKEEEEEKLGVNLDAEKALYELHRRYKEKFGKEPVGKWRKDVDWMIKKLKEE